MRNKHLNLKKRIAKENKRTKWAPFWVSFKKYGMKKGRKVHPSRYTTSKKHWRRGKSRVN